MSNYPTSIDTDAQLPRVDDNITDIGGDAINALRDAVFAIENTLGTNPQGNSPSLASRLSTSLDPVGNILPSAIAGLGLVTLPVTNSEISASAGINESKLALTYPTATLYNLFTSLNNAIDILNGWLSTIGIEVQPHINGTAYNHELSAILVDDSLPMLKTNPIPLTPSDGTNVISRDTTNADTLINDISNDLVIHEKANGNPNVTPSSGGTVPPENFAHNSTGLYLDPANFSTIPQTIDTVQEFAEYVDASSLLLLGSRVQTLYSNGIPRTSRSTSLLNDGYGAPLVPPTPVIAYLLGVPPGPISSTPVDSFTAGDDVILFQPTAGQLTNFVFDNQFALVQPGDLLTINYNNDSGLSFQFVVDSIKAQISGSVRTYAIRINGKNLFSGPNAVARIDQSLFNRNKYGVLATSVPLNSTTGNPSLIIANPRSAVALGNGFNGSEIDATHYNLYLVLYPNGDPSNASTLIQLPAIDVTGGKIGAFGPWAIEDVITNINQAFSAPGFNYRFIAFEYSGQIGIMLADPYNNASFSIIGGSGVDTNGNWTYGSGSNNATATNCPNNIVDNPGGIDPFGFGQAGANIATPPPAPIFQYISAISANLVPTLIFYPLAKNYFYVNGAERDRLRSDPNFFNQNIDSFGDGYWSASIISRTVFIDRVEAAYQIDLDLASTGLAIGKTLVVQPAFPATDSRYNYRDYGRFEITNVQFFNCDTPNAYTVITVYDAVHGAGSTPTTTSNNIPVEIYFADDSVSFDTENVFDSSSAGFPYVRFFEILVDQNGHTFSHERARFQEGVPFIEIQNVSPKLRGYPTNGDISIRLFFYSYDSTTGIYVAQLGRFNPSDSTFTNLGPVVNGKQGEIVRIYDETNIDYIDFLYTYTDSGDFTGTQHLDIQLFQSLQLDEELMCISTFLTSDAHKSIYLVNDNRQFGNVSEEQLSSSALDFITANDRELRENGIVRGFDLVDAALTGSSNFSATISAASNPTTTIINISGAISGNVGQYITISGAAISGNNGTFLISSFIGATSVTYLNPNANSSDPNNGAINWSIGPGSNISLNGGTALINGNTVNINNVSIEIPVLWEQLPDMSTNIPIISWFLCASDSGELQLIASTDYDPLSVYGDSYLANNVDQDRLFTVINPNLFGNGRYVVRGTYLSNLVINYKDITPLYVITANVLLNNNSTAYVVTGYNIIDIRRYVSNGFNGLDTLVLGTNSNFRSIESLDGWLQQLTKYISATNNKNTIGTNVIVKGGWTIDTTIYLDYAQPILFTGDDAVFIFQANNSGGFPVSGTFMVGSNVQFINIQFDNQFDATSDSNYVSGLISNNAEACVYVNVKSSPYNLAVPNPITTNISFEECMFTSSAVNRFPFIVFSFADRSCVAENINIINNTYISTSAVNDVNSIITFRYAAPNPSSAPLTGPYLIDCTIDGNKCNKDQSIIVGSDGYVVGGALVIRDLITAVNCRIINNNCGAIGVLSGKNSLTLSHQGSGSYTTAPTSDKNSSFAIQNNSCKFIYSCLSNGLVGTVISSTMFLAANAFPVSTIAPGSINVSDNTVAWIHIGSKGNGYINVNNNTLNPFDFTFLANYYTSIDYAQNAAIHIIFPLASSSFNNCMISANQIESISITTNNTSLTTYYYFIGISVDSSCFITGNKMLLPVSLSTPSISGTITNGGTTTLIQTNGVSSSIITKNVLQRVGTVQAYINNTSTAVQTIVDNFFDQPTVDGTNTTLVLGLVSGSSYSRNINQTASISISLMDYSKYQAGGYGSYSVPTGYIFSGATDTGPAWSQPISLSDKTVPGVSDESVFSVGRATSENLFAGSQYTQIQIYTQQYNAPELNFSATVPLDYLLPNDVKIINATLGVWLSEIGAGALAQTNGQANQITLALVQYKNSTGTSNILDVKNNIFVGGTFYFDTAIADVYTFTTIVFDTNAGVDGPTYQTVTENTIKNATQYCTVTPPAGSLVAGAGYKMSAEVNLNFNVQGNALALPQYVNWLLSPIVIQYRW